jgi:prepilin-type N-terminal cleavage/methylation domain-containing protein
LATCKNQSAFSLVELLAAVAILTVLAGIAFGVGRKVHASSSLAVSANNIRQLAAGGAAYLADNNYNFWPFLVKTPEGHRWWFGLEPSSSVGRPEGSRAIDMAAGPLGAYIPRGMAPDPSLRLSGAAFKPKFEFGYIGCGYNVLLANGWETFERPGARKPIRYWELQNPAQTVVFATSAQVNTFQRPASPSNPMVEEFYGIDQREATVHGRHGGNAMVAFATGNAGFLPLDPSTIDRRAPGAKIGRFAPRGSTLYLK